MRVGAGEQPDCGPETRAREPGSAARQGFGPQDAIYLITPDRFANGDPGTDTVSKYIVNWGDGTATDVTLGSVTTLGEVLTGLLLAPLPTLGQTPDKPPPSRN